MQSSCDKYCSVTKCKRGNDLRLLIGIKSWIDNHILTYRASQDFTRDCCRAVLTVIIHTHITTGLMTGQGVNPPQGANNYDLVEVVLEGDVLRAGSHVHACCRLPGHEADVRITNGKTAEASLVSCCVYLH